VAKHVYTGPSSALRAEPGSKGTRACNAKIHGMTKVKPEHVAYSMVLARVNISSADTWNEVDGGFKYRTFYYNIISTLRDNPDKAWAEATLAFWNK
ncbi:hypothetical protein BV22DRAFT_1025013, partial [Leucogyrophana mollusca]